ncbi:MAG: chemotaxis protein CheZ [Rhodospirillaceae bacterium]|nr:MAG: chemotaxis protein CheZ [Rhodospirillaceae bacterium]
MASCAKEALEASTTLNRTDEIIRIVQSVVETMEGDLSGPAVKLYQEFEQLAVFIQKAKQDIAALSPDEIQEKHIPLATDELDAIVMATERATGEILDSAEKIEAVFEKVDDEIRTKLNEAVTNIYEACSFQDITGQRISKIVATLKEIEEKVQGLVAAFGSSLPSAEEKKDGSDQKEQEDSRSLLNGPQLPGAGKSQEEIDALLSDLD